ALTLSCVGQAQGLVNGDFELDASAFVVWPGYVGQGSNPAEVPGWTGWGGRGVNPIAGGGDDAAPFSDNGSHPTPLAFLQGWAGLQQAIFGLVPGHRYVLSLDYNARICCGDLPLASVSINGAVFWATQDPVLPVGGNNPWYSINIAFTAQE